MVVMSADGFLAGEKQDAVKLTLKEGEIILPVSPTPLSEVKSAATFGGPSGPQLAATDASYNSDNKKLAFTDGVLTFADGKQLVVAKGRIVFDKSRGLFGSGSVNPA